jgi:hypothetical protein
MFHLLNNAIPNGRSLERSSQRKTQILHRQQSHSTHKNASPTSTSPTLPAETISDLDKFIFNPDTSSNHNNRHYKLQSYSQLRSQKIKVSSANNKCDTIISLGFLDPTENSDRKEPAVHNSKHHPT